MKMRYDEWQYKNRLAFPSLLLKCPMYKGKIGFYRPFCRGKACAWWKEVRCLVLYLRVSPDPQILLPLD